MKHLKFFATFFVATGSLFMVSCNSGKDKKADEKMPDSTTNKMEPSMAPSGPTSIMIVRHKVVNYAKWKAGYDAHDSARLANGLHNYVICRGTEDSNMVMVALKMDDAEKAKAFGSSKELQAKMKELGVTGKPVVDYVESVMNDTTSIQATIRVMIRSKVKDWDVWKKSFDSHIQKRIEAGLTDRVISHTVGDTHQVTLVFAVADMAKATAFMNSQDLKDRMKEAGVEGPPDVFYYKVTQRY